MFIINIVYLLYAYKILKIMFFNYQSLLIIFILLINQCRTWNKQLNRFPFILQMDQFLLGIFTLDNGIFA